MFDLGIRLSADATRSYLGSIYSVRILGGMQHSVVCNSVAKDRPGEHIRRVVRLQRDPGDSHSRSETIRDPCVPARIRMAVRIHRCHGECRNGVPGRKASDTPYDAFRMTSEPGVGEISVERNLDGFHSAVDVFHDAGQKLGTEHRSPANKNVCWA